MFCTTCVYVPVCSNKTENGFHFQFHCYKVGIFYYPFAHISLYLSLLRDQDSQLSIWTIDLFILLCILYTYGSVKKGVLIVLYKEVFLFFSIKRNQSELKCSCNLLCHIILHYYSFSYRICIYSEISFVHV